VSKAIIIPDLAYTSPKGQRGGNSNGYKEMIARIKYLRGTHRSKRRDQTGKVAVTTQQATNQAQGNDSASDMRGRISGTGGRDMERESSSANRGRRVSVWK